MSMCFPTGRAYPSLGYVPCKRPWNTDELVFIDVETTGLDPKTDRIWELALAFPGGTCLSWTFNPEKELTPHVQKLCNKEDFDFSSCPLFKDCWEEIRDCIDDLQLASYNTKFDRSFLKAELARMNETLETSSWLDPLIWARAYLPKPHKLHVVAEHLGIPSWTTHAATGDAMGGLQVLQALAEFMPQDLDTALYEQRNLAYQYYLKKGTPCPNLPTKKSKPLTPTKPLVLSLIPASLTGACSHGLL